MSQQSSSVIPGFRYKDAKAAVEWLCTVLGFERHSVFEDANGVVLHAELTLGGGMIMVGQEKDDELGRTFKSPASLGGVETCAVCLVVKDVDAAHARAVAAGAQIVRPLAETPYGSREFGVNDPEGHSWYVGTYDPWQPKPQA
jgi:uncharacterized glyoxalase superfamily protein PhnB